MGTQRPLVGREAELARLGESLARASAGEGSLLLLCGEAGVGKSRLAAALAGSAGNVIQGAAASGLTAPYGPVIDALRSRLRTEPGALDGCGPLRAHLALLLPELGPAAEESDRATIFEAIRCALAHLAAERPLLVVLDDLQWSDEATIELLAALATPLGELPVMVLAAYRSDGLPREHRLRWLRNELRRARRLDELALEPFDAEATARLLSELLGEEPSPALVGAVQDRTMGSPFFAEELVAALRLRGGLRAGGRGLELAGEEDVPVPDTVREAVLVRMSELSPQGREAAEVAAVAGPQVDLELAAELAAPQGFLELTEAGLLREAGGGQAGFRHALTREAIYAGVPWIKRRQLHAAFAAAIEAREGSSFELAVHWRAAGDAARTREALVRAAAESEGCRLTATRRGRRARRSSTGKRGKRRSCGGRRWPAAAVAGRSRGSSAKPRKRGASWPPPATATTTRAATQAPSATSPPSTTCWENATPPSPPAASPPTRTRAAARRPRRRPSGWRWRITIAAAAVSPKRSSWRGSPARTPRRPAAPTSAPGSSVCAGSPKQRAASSTPASPRCRRASPWRSSTS
jgi:energy-coupling factor transporter ATP-binding protein EcfA2